MDPNSIWADFDDAGNVEEPGKFNFGAVFGGLLKTGTDLGKAYLTPKPKPQPQQQPIVQPARNPAWLMPALIGGGVLVLLLFAGLLFGKR
jgi:hypothetical protein